MVDTMFKSDAKQITDLAFDNKLFREDLTRDDFNAFEDLITFLLQSRFESYQKLTAITDRIENRRNSREKI